MGPGHIRSKDQFGREIDRYIQGDDRPDRDYDEDDRYEAEEAEYDRRKEEE